MYVCFADEEFNETEVCHQSEMTTKCSQKSNQTFCDRHKNVIVGILIVLVTILFGSVCYLMFAQLTDEGKN